MNKIIKKNSFVFPLPSTLVKQFLYRMTIFLVLLVKSNGIPTYYTILRYNIRF